MTHIFEIFKYLIKEKMVDHKHLRENLIFLNNWVSSRLNFRFSQIPRIALNSLYLSPSSAEKTEDFVVSSALVIVDQNQEFSGLLNISRKISKVEINLRK